MFVTLSHHYGLSCCAICTDDCRSAADNSSSQRSLDGVGELGKLRMLLPDVLNHLSLRYKDTECHCELLQTQSYSRSPLEVKYRL